MKTIWEELAEFIEETKDMAQACHVTLDELLAIFLKFKKEKR